ncbi:hypothetical protein BayCH28_11870 [Mycolicibacterium sp. CH28]|uniref:hypothetical protein n=1 Tax=Mycolicibacterium sp. CH28 TaxID=2512237 RepID=UPI0010812DE1|nr:hypothetical protein [Mycolicibacterium sp. CH28]TGD88420.1 hypothetical protein BayCH28_11870 [Mycolicibacterium sp. CH28]
MSIVIALPSTTFSGNPPGSSRRSRSFAAMLDECEHAVYEVRRLTRRSSVRADGRGITARSVRALARDSREQMEEELRECAGERRVGADGIARQVVRERGERLPALEHFFVVCPAVRRRFRSCGPGSIILLHVMLESRSVSRTAVPQIIDRLQSEGYHFVTVSELLSLKDGWTGTDP